MPREDFDVYTSLIAPRAQVATTLVLRLEDVHRGIATGRLSGALDLYTPDRAETVMLAFDGEIDATPTASTA